MGDFTMTNQTVTPLSLPPPAGHQGLSPLDILCLLDLADQEIAVSRQPEKVRASRSRRSILLPVSTDAIVVRAGRTGRCRRHEYVCRPQLVDPERRNAHRCSVALNAMQPDILVIRHASAGAAAYSRRKSAVRWSSGDSCRTNTPPKHFSMR